MKKYIFVISFLVAVMIASPNISLAVEAGDRASSSYADLQAQIQALLAQIAALQAQMSQQQPQQWCYDFKYNLNAQSRGKEVSQLQTALEKEEFEINVSEKTSQSFGESTADAVVGFQQKYKEEILAPYKLKYGTGFVGKSTKAKLNSLYNCGVIQPIPIPVPIPTPIPVSVSPTPLIISFSPNSATIGTNTKIRVYGNNLNSVNKIVFGLIGSADRYAAEFSLISNTGIEVLTPTNLPIGKYCIATTDFCPANSSEFTISPATSSISVPSITVLSPNGGEIINWSSSHKISWKASDDISKVSIALYRNDASYAWIAVDLPVGIGGISNYYNWTSSQTITSPDIGNIFKIYMIGYKTNGGTVEDKSDAAFSIVASTTSIFPSAPKVDLKVNDSNGPLTVKVGDAITLTWNSENASYCIGEGFNFTGKNYGSWFDVKKPSSGTEIFTSFPYYFNARIGIVCMTTSGQFNRDNVYVTGIKFSSTSTTPSITVLSPNGGEVWEIGKTHEIKWKSNDIGEWVSILIQNYNYDNITNFGWSSEWKLAPNSGSYQFTVPTTASLSNTYKATVQKTYAGYNPIQGIDIDNSDEFFSIIKPTQKFIISDVFGYKSTYNFGEKLSLKINGIETDKNSTSPDQGFNVIVSIYNKDTGKAVAQNNGILGGSANYSNGYWYFNPSEILNTGNYYMNIYLYCSKDEATCAARYGKAAQVEKRLDFDVISIVNSLVCKSVDFEDDPYVGSNITGNSSHIQWFSSKGLEITGTPSGYVNTTKMSGGAGQSGVVIGFGSPNFLEQDAGISDDEVLDIKFLNESVNSVIVTVASTPSSESIINNQSSNVIMDAFNETGSLIGSATKTFTGVTNGAYTVSAVGLSGLSNAIKKITLRATQHPYGGVWVEKVEFGAVCSFGQMPPHNQMANVLESSKNILIQLSDYLGRF